VSLILSILGEKAEPCRLTLVSGRCGRLAFAAGQQFFYLRWKTRVIALWSGLSTLTIISPSAARV
jgi:hypothetical protein